MLQLRTGFMDQGFEFGGLVAGRHRSTNVDRDGIVRHIVSVYVRIFPCWWDGPLLLLLAAVWCLVAILWGLPIWLGVLGGLGLASGVWALKW